MRVKFIFALTYFSASPQSRFSGARSEPGPDLQNGSASRAPRSDGNTYFGFQLLSTGRSRKISKVPRSPRNKNLAQAITWFVRVTIHCTSFHLQHISMWPVFTRQKTFEKKSEGKFTLNKLSNLNLGGLDPLGHTCTFITVFFFFFFMTKQKSKSKILEWFIICC